MSGIVPFIVTSGVETGFYFLGRIDGFTAVTVSPIFAPEYAAVIRVFKEVNPTGGFDLVYEEASLATTMLASLDTELPFSHRKIIFSNLHSVGFSYFSAPSIEQAFVVNSHGELVDNKKWLNAHDGFEKKTQPSQIRIDLDGYLIFALIAERAKVQSSRNVGQDDTNV